MPLKYCAVKIILSLIIASILVISLKTKS